MTDPGFVRLHIEAFDGEELGEVFVLPSEVAVVKGNLGRIGCTVCTRGGSEIFDVKGYPDDVMGMLFSMVTVDKAKSMTGLDAQQPRPPHLWELARANALALKKQFEHEDADTKPNQGTD